MQGMNGKDLEVRVFGNLVKSSGKWHQPLEVQHNLSRQMIFQQLSYSTLNYFFVKAGTMHDNRQLRFILNLWANHVQTTLEQFVVLHELKQSQKQVLGVETVFNQKQD